MKAVKIMRIPTVLVGLGLTAFLAVPSRAQQEVAPDIYEASAVQSVPQPQNVVLRQDKQAADFQGNFTLAHRVECAGKILAPGTYSLSLHSAGPNRLITLRGKSRMMTLSARAVSRHATARQSMLLVRRDAELPRLKAIYLEKLGLLLYLEPDAKLDIARNPDEMERVPIS